MSWVQLRHAYLYWFFFPFFFSFLALESTNAHFTQSGPFITSVTCSSRIYAIHSLSLSHKYFFLYFVLPFAHLRTHTHKYRTPIYARVLTRIISHSLFTLALKRIPITHDNAIQLYNNLKKCIVYLCIKIRGAIARGRTTVVDRTFDMNW